MDLVHMDGTEVGEDDVIGAGNWRVVPGEQLLAP
jgi:hypothetical protein